MSSSTSQESTTHLNAIPLFFCVTVFAVGVILLLLPSSGDPIVRPRPTDVSDHEVGAAAKPWKVNEDRPADLPFATTSQGEVVEISDQLLIVNRSGELLKWPMARQTQIWKAGEIVAATDVKPGDTVKVDVQQLGNRRDGWIKTAMKINVARRDLPDTTDSSQLAMPTTKVSGVVVEVRNGAIVIEDVNGLRSTYPLQGTALVLAGAETISLQELSGGDHVELTTARNGSRLDGWLKTVTHVERKLPQ